MSARTSAFAITAILMAASLAPAAPKPKQPPKAQPQANLLAPALNGPLAQVQDIVFAVREFGHDGHWYANFGYYCPDADRKAYGAGGKLCRLNLRTGRATVLLDDPQGSVRDPQVDYDGKKILFSYRKGGTDCYNLYEINADGSSLHRLTDAPFDDIEPSYLPDGGIVFVSSRCKRWVNCWLTQVAVMHRCDGDGRNIRILSANIEQDNTPWPMPDGRILYTRWEYVDRNQLGYHHLWTSNPDGTGISVFFGNMHAGTVMIDAKPIPGTNKVVAIFSPGHGRTEHAGDVTIVTPVAGPDDLESAVHLTSKGRYRDPFPISPDLFLVAQGNDLLLMDGHGATQVIYSNAGTPVHEPRPIISRPREPIIPSRVDLAQSSGKLILSDVNFGRNMAGVKPGEIKKLLVVESLPKPVNFTGGMDPLSYGGTFTLERVLGTVPVEADGSAYLEIPPLRSLFLVALDEKNLSVKRMQSFLSVQPGETIGCAGCHEQRTSAPPMRSNLMALRRPPSQIEPIRDVPDVFDFPRDIQPILNAHCVACHDYGKPNNAGVILCGDRGPLFSHSYYTLLERKLVSDGRNGAGNRPPRSIGSSASPLMQYLDGAHHGVRASDLERTKVRLWIETGAPFPGTYAALDTGMLGRYVENHLDASGADHPLIQASQRALERRCLHCHQARGVVLPLSPWDDQRNQPWLGLKDQVSRHFAYNLTRPPMSLILLAPLSREAGGLGTCRARMPNPGNAQDVFLSTEDSDYAAILAGIEQAKRQLEEVRRFDMPGFRPDPAYVREMKRFGILPESFDLSKDPIDVYATDRAYWRSLWWTPQPQLIGDAR